MLLTPEDLASRIDAAADNRVLEVGCGPGYFTPEIARRVSAGCVELLDAQPEMLAKAKNTLLENGIRNVGFTVHDANEPFPFRDGSFDVVLMVAVLGEVRERESCLAELARLLQPGGKLVIHEQHPDLHFQSFRTVALLAEGAGFTLLERYGPRWNFTAVFGQDTEATCQQRRRIRWKP